MLAERFPQPTAVRLSDRLTATPLVPPDVKYQPAPGRVNATIPA
jgi:hypothetical protein